MQTECSLPYSHHPVTFLYPDPDPDGSSPQPLTLFP